MATGSAKARVSSEDFVRVCNTSDSIVEVAEKLGMTPNNVHQRRNKYAKQGVKFKVYDSRRGGNRLDYAAIAKMSEETLPEGATTFQPETRSGTTADA